MQSQTWEWYLSHLSDRLWPVPWFHVCQCLWVAGRSSEPQIRGVSLLRYCPCILLGMWLRAGTAALSALTSIFLLSHPLRASLETLGKEDPLDLMATL